MDGLELTNKEMHDVFIPCSAIDRITIEPNTEWTYLEKNWWQKIFGGHYENVETGKWDMRIDTIGGNRNRIIFADKEAALKRLEEIKSTRPVDIVINKLTIEDSQ